MMQMGCGAGEEGERIEVDGGRGGQRENQDWSGWVKGKKGFQDLGRWM